MTALMCVWGRWKLCQHKWPTEQVSRHKLSFSKEIFFVNRKTYRTSLSIYVSFKGLSQLVVRVPYCHHTTIISLPKNHTTNCKRPFVLDKYLTTSIHTLNLRENLSVIKYVVLYCICIYTSISALQFTSMVEKASLDCVEDLCGLLSALLSVLHLY